MEELDAASNNGVDNIRALRDEAVFTPAAVRKRVYIVDEVHMLSTAAFNALLKILEEPPEHLVFILATTELQKVPATILSRCQRFSFRRITPEDIAARLRYVSEREGLRLTEGAAALLSRLADGSMRDALSLLDQCASVENIDENAVYESVGLAGALETAKLLELIASGDAAGALALFDRAYFGGKDPVAFLGELCSLCRDVLISEIAPRGGSGLLSGAYPPDIIADFAKKLKKPTLLRYMTALQDAQASASRTNDRRTGAELCLVSLADPGTAEDIPALCARVERLESGAVIPAAPPASPPEKPLAEDDIVPWEEPPLPEAPPVPEESPPPEETPIPEKTPEQPEDDLWPAVFQEARASLTPPQRMILDSRDNAEAAISDGVLTLYFKNDFAEKMLNVTNVMTALKNAAEKLTGSPCVVRGERAEARTAPAVTKKNGGEDKLDRLGRFANVTFE